MKKRKTIMVAVSAVGLIAALSSPVIVTQSIRDALQLCARVLIPSLFPYMVFASLLATALSAEMNTGTHRFGKNGTGRLMILLGALSGYPTGAKSIGEMYRAGRLTKAESHRLLSFSCNAGPAFIFGVIGSLYGSVRVGIVLMCIHLGSAWLLSLLLPKKESSDDAGAKYNSSALPPFSDCLLEAVQSAVHALIKIVGLVCLFSMLTAFEQKFFSKSETLLPILSIFTELASGSALLAESGLSWSAKFSVTAAAVSFGGLCVLLQTAAVLSGSGLSVRHYVVGKILQAAISAAAAWPVSKLLGPALPTAAISSAHLVLSPWPWTLFSAAMVVIIFLQFPSSNFVSREL